MTCPECGCTAMWACDYNAAIGAEPVFDEVAVLKTAAAYDIAVLSRLAQQPAPAPGARAYADRALVQLQQMLAAAGLLDRDEGRMQGTSPRALLR